MVVAESVFNRRVEQLGIQLITWTGALAATSIVRSGLGSLKGG